MKTLIIIDYTNDFVAAEGALTCGEPGRAIDGYVAATAEEFLKNGDFVVFATDLHVPNDPYHPETRLFPTHNVAGTWGRELYGKVGKLHHKYADNPNVYYMDKARYSAFAGTDLLLRLRSRGIEEAHVVGVCTDICVLHTLVDAYNLGFKLFVHERGVASFDHVGHAWALRHFASTLGADIL